MNTIHVNQGASSQIFQILYKAALESLNSGDILQGKVLSLENGLLFLALKDGSSFTARVPEGFTASKGDVITLEIGERQNNQLTARIVHNSIEGSVEKAQEQTLTEAIADNLSAFGASKPQELIGGVLDLVGAMPELPLEQASFLVSNGLDNDPEMIKVIKMISEHEFKIHDNLKALHEGLSDAISQMDDLSKQEIVKDLLVYKGVDDLTQSLKDIFPDTDPAVKDTIINNLREILTKTLMAEIEKGASEQQTFTPQSIEELAKSVILQLQQKASGREARLWNETIEPKLDLLVKTVQSAIEKIHLPDKDSKVEEKDIRLLLEKLFERATVEIENGSPEKTDIGEKIRSLKDIMDFAQKALDKTGAETREMSLPAYKELDNVLKFFHQASTYDSMLHIPLKINGRKTSGELYVMKRKKGRSKIDPQNFTLFLSLQTSSLGQVESFLNAGRKYITVSFRVKDENLVRFFKENHRLLYDGLLKKGYKLAEMKCGLLEDRKTTLLNAHKKAKEALGLEASVDVKI